MIVLPVVVGLAAAPLAAPGRYGVDIAVNGEHRQSIGFAAVRQRGGVRQH